jgi:hypothetical protein
MLMLILMLLLVRAWARGTQNTKANPTPTTKGKDGKARGGKTFSSITFPYVNHHHGPQEAEEEKKSRPNH